MSNAPISSTLSHKNKIYTLSCCALMTAVMCIVAPFSIPIGPIPISLTNFAIYLSLYLLGWKLATTSYLIYLLIGMIGIPVFSGFTGGIGKLLGPTGGYIIGFFPMILLSGILLAKYQNRWIQFAALVLGTIICYIFGTAWFCMESQSTLSAALGLCVFPFIPGDLLKIILAMILGSIIRKSLNRAGIA